MATRATKGRSTSPETPKQRPLRSKPLVLVSGAVAIIAVVAVVLALTLGSSPKPAPTKAQVRSASQANLLATTSAMAAYEKARTTCTTAACVATAAQTAENSLKTSWDTFNVAASGYTPLASTLGTYAVDFAKLLGALDLIAHATTVAQIDIIESEQLSPAQGTWLTEASSLFGQLGGAVHGPGGSN